MVRGGEKGQSVTLFGCPTSSCRRLCFAALAKRLNCSVGWQQARIRRHSILKAQAGMFSVAIEPDLVMRLFELRHTAELYNCFVANRTHLESELPWLSQPFTHDDVSAYIRAGLERFAANNGFRAGIWSSQQLVGCFSLHTLEWADGKASLGYWLAAPFERRGIITRACQVAINYAFFELGLERLEIMCASDNMRSRQVAMRLGFQQEGILRRSWRRQGQLVDQVVYGLMRDEWRPAHNQ